MATDATGSPTPLGIPKYNTSADAPSGLGFNAAMDAIDALVTARVAKPSGIAAGEAPVWNGSGWDRSSVTRIGSSSLGSGGAGAGAKFLADDQTFKTAGGMTSVFDSVAGGSVASIDSGVMTVAGFKHMMVVFNGRSDKAASTLDSLALQLNNDTGTNYAWGNTDGVSGASVAFIRIGYVAAATAPTNSPTSLSIIIPDFANTVFNKTIRSSAPALNDAATPTFINKEFAGTWKPASPAGITRIKVFPEGSNLILGTRVSVYVF